jgi:NitT/TauT family transport system ATP-binding protein
MSNMTDQSSGRGIAPAATVHFDEVRKWYPTTGEPVHAVDGVTLDLNEGEFISIVGPSGCGKSTLMLMLAGLIAPTAGTIIIGETKVDGPYTDLGIVFQDPVLLDWLDVMGNVMLQAKMRGLDAAESRERARELLDLVGLEGFEKRRPYELSGGMKQRVSICRALLHSPPLLLMDEPFGALDALTRDQLNLDLLDLWGRNQSIVLFVTHSITEAVYLSDRVVVMSPRPGRVERIIDVDLPRPRPLSIRETPEFGTYANEIRAIFGRLGILKGVGSEARDEAGGL